jgi:hypothetical protein
MMLLDPGVLRDLLAEAYDEGNRRPRGEGNPYRSDDGPQ